MRPIWVRVAAVISVCAAAAACDSRDPTGVISANDIAPSGTHMGPEHVTDLRVSAVTDTSMTLTWTQIALSDGEPARYRVKTGSSGELSTDWPDARVVCDRTIVGTEPGDPLSCTAHGFDPGTAHLFRLGSFGIEDGSWIEFQYSNTAGGQTHAHEVTDLVVFTAEPTRLHLRWTQVDDGTGQPAWYRVKYGSPLESWSQGTVGCDRSIRGTAIGEEMTCVIEGLEEDILYEVQLASFRPVNGVWTNTRLSNVAGGRFISEEAGAVDDLRFVPGSTPASVTLTWTQVDDGTGNPARYRLKYGDPMWSYSDATVGCNVRGTAIGDPLSCTITDPVPAGTIREFRLMSYRLVDGRWVDAKFSNIEGFFASN